MTQIRTERLLLRPVHGKLPAANTHVAGTVVPSRIGTYKLKAKATRMSAKASTKSSASKRPGLVAGVTSPEGKNAGPAGV